MNDTPAGDRPNPLAEIRFGGNVRLLSQTRQDESLSVKEIRVKHGR